ncbi:MAG: hypothetical protein CMH53_02995 [Myxococcales bacterium]|nr:hypothetical protein [Myxococcales bacterium]
MRRSDSEAIEITLEQEPNQARQLVQQLLQAQDDDADLWAYLAECESELRNHNAALKAWAHYLTLDPHWPEAYTARCDLFIEQGDIDGALTELKLVKEIADDDARVMRAEALLAEAQGQMQQADELYEQAEQCDALWPAPPRVSRQALQAALQRVHRGGSVRVEEMPESALPHGFLRLQDVTADGDAIVYARNLERDFDQDATVMDLVEAYESEVTEE